MHSKILCLIVLLRDVDTKASHIHVGRNNGLETENAQTDASVPFHDASGREASRTDFDAVAYIRRRVCQNRPTARIDVVVRRVHSSSDQALISLSKNVALRYSLS
ncbi:hypothetical protein F5X98DRAFT_339406, partial [Xylaria grammica]